MSFLCLGSRHTKNEGYPTMNEKMADHVAEQSKNDVTPPTGTPSHHCTEMFYYPKTPRLYPLKLIFMIWKVFPSSLTSKLPKKYNHWVQYNLVSSQTSYHYYFPSILPNNLSETRSERRGRYEESRYHGMAKHGVKLVGKMEDHSIKS